PMAVIYQHANAPRPVLIEGFRQLQPILDRMLAVDPGDRFQSAAEVLESFPAPRPVVASARAE
ncbi:MAG TPA: hypothetical protein VLD39_12970, partial [Gammaproteobacteria bacterium]|nr:hypothetical protein [Gammaproteobacteria bacterium]